MRTIRLVYTSEIDATTALRLETEVIANDDDEAEEQGADAWRFIRRFLAGIGTATGDET